MLAGKYGNPMLTRFLAPIAGLKLPPLASRLFFCPLTVSVHGGRVERERQLTGPHSGSVFHRDIHNSFSERLV
jgi:hypothetical protein